MPVWGSRLLIAVLALPAFAVSPTMADEALWSALKAGGKVVLMRHAAVERGTPPLKHVPGNCGVEQNLSKAGARQAQEIGAAFRQRAIPLGDVLASPYCRTMETARLAFGKANASEALHLREALDARETNKRTDEVMRLIGSYQGTGNLILVTHQPNVEAIALESVEPAGILVLQPKGGGDFDVLGKLTAPKSE